MKHKREYLVDDNAKVLRTTCGVANIGHVADGRACCRGIRLDAEGLLTDDSLSKEDSRRARFEYILVSDRVRGDVNIRDRHIASDRALCICSWKAVISKFDSKYSQ